MKITDNEIKKAFEQINIPEPSQSARNSAMQAAMDEFAKNNATAEKKRQGFFNSIRQMGTTLIETLTLKGDPVMTRKLLGTVGVLVIAVGLFLTLGPQLMITTKPAMEPQVETIRQDAAKLEPETKQDAGELKGAGTPAQIAEPVKMAETVVAEQASSQPMIADQYQEAPIGLQQELETAPQSAAPAKREMLRPAAPPLQVEGRAMQGMAFEADGFIMPPQPGYYKDEGRDQFADIETNAVKLAAEEPVSTFSIDVDTASYGFVRRQLNNGLLPQKNSVRIEEMINYFAYGYALPQDRSQPFKPTVAVYPTPWNNNTRLLHIGIKGYDILPEETPRANLVFLLDVSGSMNSADKLPLLKNSFSMLVETLTPEDTVAIVVYAGAAGTVLEPTKVKEKGKILAALDNLQAGGSTAGGEGIRLAYSLAEMNFDKQGVNRVILATDGDFNVGITDHSELQSFIEHKRKTGVFLSVLGFGQGNYNDALMQTLAQNGNGNAAYIDNLNEARKVLVDEASSTLFTIAKDVKIQVEFNPARVHDYRLIGYETRLLNREDFNNDKVDAGEIGAGHSVTAIYEITPVESKEKMIDDLRYQKEGEKAAPVASSEYAFLKIRYKLPSEDTSKLITLPITNEQAQEDITAVSSDMQFAAAVAAFGQLLRNDPFTRDFSYDDILKLAEPARGRDQFGYRTEFLNLVRLAKTAKAM